MAVSPVIVVNEIFGRCVPQKRLGDLIGKLFGGVVCRAPYPENLPSFQMHDEEGKEAFEGDRRNDEEINRGNSIGVIAKKCLQALGQGIVPPDHVFRHRGLGDREAPASEVRDGCVVRPRADSPRASVGPDVVSRHRPSGAPELQDFQRQYARNPMRCQRTNISGRTIVAALNTSGQRR
jgi:hypothetical protein